MSDVLSADVSETPAPPRPKRRPPGFVQWLHAVALASFVVVFFVGADHWGWATVLAYGPRWPWLVPGALVMLGAMAAGRRFTLTLGVITAAAVLLLDVHVPWSRLLRVVDGRKPTASLRIMTLNADGGGTDGLGTNLARIGALIADIKPDVVFFQEWRERNPPPLPPGTWNVRRENSQMIVTRLPVDSVAFLSPDKLLGESAVFGCRVEAVPGVKTWLFTPHLETPRRGFKHLLQGKADALEVTDQITARRQTVSERAVTWIDEIAGNSDVIVGGDFNLVGDGRIFRSTWAVAFTDAFSAAGWGVGGTKLQTGWRPRIDHVLTGSGWRAVRCAPGRDVGSDHLPLIADVERVAE